MIAAVKLLLFKYRHSFFSLFSLIMITTVMVYYVLLEFIVYVTDVKTIS